MSHAVMRFRTAGGVALLCLLAGGLFAGSANAQGGPPSFTELAGAPGCLGTFFLVQETDCSRQGGLDRARSVTVSPDDRFVYVASGGGTAFDFSGRGVTTGSNAVSAFRREAGTGALEPAGCISASGGDGRPGSEGSCARGDALLGASDVAISPDGRRAYVASAGSNGVAYLDRDPETGALTPAGCLKEAPRQDRCDHAPPLVGAAEVAVAPEGTDVYVAAAGDGAINAFRKDEETGAMASVQCVSATGSDGLCEPVAGLSNVRDIVVSPAGGEVYTASFDGVVAAFARDPETGRLRQTGCLLDDAPRVGPCARGIGLAGARDVAVSPDGRDVYVAGGAGSGVVTSFRRGADGALSQTGCIEYQPPPEPMEEEEPEEETDEEEPEEDEPEEEEPDEESVAEQAQERCTVITGLVQPFAEVVVSGDGRTVFAGGNRHVAMFRRDPDRGTLTPAGCAGASDLDEDDACVELRALNFQVDSIAATSDGRNLYLLSHGEGALRVLGASVAIASASLRANRGGRVGIPLACPAARSRPCAGRVALRGTRSRRYLVRPGARRRVPVRLGARARQRLARRGAIRLHARASDRRGLLRPTVKRVTVRRAARTQPASGSGIR